MTEDIQKKQWILTKKLKLTAWKSHGMFLMFVIVKEQYTLENILRISNLLIADEQCWRNRSASNPSTPWEKFSYKSDCNNLWNRMVRNISFLQTAHFIKLTLPLVMKTVFTYTMITKLPKHINTRIFKTSNTFLINHFDYFISSITKIPSQFQPKFHLVLLHCHNPL